MYKLKEPAAKLPLPFKTLLVWDLFNQIARGSLGTCSNPNFTGKGSEAQSDSPKYTQLVNSKELDNRL